MRKSLNLDAMKCIYYSLAYSHIISCISVWGGCYARHANQLIIKQKRIVRTISQVNRLHHTAELFIDLKFLQFNNIFIYFTSLLAFKCINHEYIEGLCNPIMHNYGTRFAAQNMIMPLARTNLIQKSFVYNTPKIWNSLPANIKSLPTLNSFKYNLKKYLLDLQIADI